MGVDFYSEHKPLNHNWGDHKGLELWNIHLNRLPKRIVELERQNILKAISDLEQGKLKEWEQEQLNRGWDTRENLIKKGIEHQKKQLGEKVDFVHEEAPNGPVTHHIGFKYGDEDPVEQSYLHVRASSYNSGGLHHFLDAYGVDTAFMFRDEDWKPEELGALLSHLQSMKQLIEQSPDTVIHPLEPKEGDKIVLGMQILMTKTGFDHITPKPSAGAIYNTESKENYLEWFQSIIDFVEVCKRNDVGFKCSY